MNPGPDGWKLLRQQLEELQGKAKAREQQFESAGNYRTANTYHGEVFAYGMALAIMDGLDRGRAAAGRGS